MSLLAFAVVVALQATPCVTPQRVKAPCDGQLLSHTDAATLLACRDADLPACEKQAGIAVEQAALVASDLRAELLAAKAWAATQAGRADSLSALLDAAVTPPAPAPEWWQSSAWVVTVSVVAVGALTAAVVLAVVE